MLNGNTFKKLTDTENDQTHGNFIPFYICLNNSNSFVSAVHELFFVQHEIHIK